MKGAALMNNFDRMIKEKARSEKISVPEGFDERIDGIIDGLQRVGETSLNIRKRKSYKPGVFAAAACIIFMLLGCIFIVGFDRVYATIAKAVPYVIGFGRTDSSNSNALYAVKDEVTFYDSLDNRYIIKSAYRIGSEVRIVMAVYYKESIKQNMQELIKDFKVISNGVEYKSTLLGAEVKTNHMFFINRDRGQIEIAAFDVPETENLTFVYDGEEVPIKLEKVAETAYEGMTMVGSLYKMSIMPLYNSNMVGAEVVRKEEFPLNLSNISQQQPPSVSGCFLEDDKGKKYVPDRLLQRNEFMLNDEKLLDMKYFVVDRIMEIIHLDEKDNQAVTFRMPEVGEKIDINYKGSIDGFKFTIQSAEKRLFKQEYKYQVNNEELSMIVEFDSLPENVEVDLTTTFRESPGYGRSTREINRSPEGKVIYEYVFHNDDGAITPSKSIFLDKTELEMKISGYTITEDVDWRVELKK
jgi:hypothetical protein